MISAVILTKNSAKSIQKAIESVLWCNEIIVIDDYSTDETVSLVNKYKVKFFLSHLQEDFALQRNFALTKSKFEWTLFIDSDEILTKELQTEIISRLKHDTHINGYFIRRIDVLYNHELKYGETGSISLLRLAKTKSGVWSRAVHETWQINGPTTQLSSNIMHYPHQTVAGFIQSLSFYASLHAKELITEGRKFHFSHIIIYPIGKFIWNYIFKLGFLDGTVGFYVAVMMSLHSFLTRVKMWEWKHNIK